jgi:hypothetical protein
MKRPKIVHHFTCHPWLRFIENEGITRGKTHLTRSRVITAPNFTTDPEPDHQGWAVGSMMNKRAIRLTVRVRHHDTAWIPWLELAHQNGCEPHFIHALNKNGGGGMNHWWIHRGPVPLADIITVETIGEPTVSDQITLEHIIAWGTSTYAEYQDREISEGMIALRPDPRPGAGDRLIPTPTPKFIGLILERDPHFLDNAIKIRKGGPRKRST